MKLILRTVIMFGLVALFLGCQQTREDNDLSKVLKQYETIIRWAQWDAATDFIAPEYLEKHPITTGNGQVTAVSGYPVHLTLIGAD